MNDDLSLMIYFPRSWYATEAGVWLRQRFKDWRLWVPDRIGREYLGVPMRATDIDFL